MKKGSIPTNSKFRGFSALVAVALSLQGHVAAAKAPTGEQSPASPLVQANVADIRTEQRARITYDAYILGPGDILQIELLDLPELSGTFSIGPDGTIYLPRLRVLYVEGLTVEEFRIFLTKQFSTYVRDPEIYIRPVAYRPIRVYVGGEVKRPGFYTLSETLNFDRVSTSTERQLFQASEGLNTNQSGLGQLPGGASIGSSENSLSTFGKVFPTVFDAIRRARGITPYSDLSKVEVIRKRAEGLGGGRIKTTLNFLELITEGESIGLDIQFLGRLPNHRLPALYRSHPVYVICSKYEGNPKTLLEAMSCGCAVIGTNVPGIREVIEHEKSGLLVEESVDSLRSAILRLMDDEGLRIRLGKEARRQIMAENSLEAAIQQELNVYQELCDC